jgi:hypothetical protein
MIIQRLYNELSRLIGYKLVLQDTYDPITFELNKKCGYLALYKYIGNYKHDGSVKLKMIWQRKLR